MVFFALSVFFEFNGGGAKAAVMTLGVLLSCLLVSHFFWFVSLVFPLFFLSAGLMSVSSSSFSCVSSVQQLFFPVQHVCSSCSLSDILASN